MARDGGTSICVHCLSQQAKHFLSLQERHEENRKMSYFAREVGWRARTQPTETARASLIKTSKKMRSPLPLCRMSYSTSSRDYRTKHEARHPLTSFRPTGGCTSAVLYSHLFYSRHSQIHGGSSKCKASLRFSATFGKAPSVS